MKPSVVDLFCGCGGFSLGFERAGFRIIAAYDNWRPAVDTYNNNFQHAAQLVEISKTSELPKSTVIIGGPPCQGFSSAGLRKSHDERNTLVSIFSELVVHHKPDAFVFENVEGFLTGANGRFVFDLLVPLVEAGYRIHLRKVNAANYGTPQHRKRVVVIGGLGWDPSFPKSTHFAFGAPGAGLANGQHFPPSPTIAEALDCLPNAVARGSDSNIDFFDHTYTSFNDVDMERARHLKPGQRMRDIPESMWHDSYRRRAHRRVMDGMPTERRGGAPAGLRRLSSNEPSKAITGGSLREYVHPIEDRPLTIRECARIQTFPDNFKLEGTQGEKIQMIGNSVPVLLSEIIAISLMKDLGSPLQKHNCGALLSFIPTLSRGMSPVLTALCEEVRERFSSKAISEQLNLCL